MREKDLNGKTLAKKLKKRLKERVNNFVQSTKITPALAMVQVGEDPSAAAYVKSKQRMCAKMGINSELVQLPESSSLSQLKNTIRELNGSHSVHGIILELPLPQHIPFSEAVSSIDPDKDVDGLHPLNLGLLFSGTPSYIPNTPNAVMKLLEYYEAPLKGQRVTIIGRSLAVGKPLFSLMLAKHATVTVCHSRTTDLKEQASKADILVVAVGKAKLVKADFVKEGAIVVDVGINVTDEGLVGDVDYDHVYDKASKITPVPGGVGPLTVAMIIENTLNAAIYHMETRVYKNNLHVIK